MMVTNFTLSQCKTYCTASSVQSNIGKKEIVVPYRIQRSPTDILKALSTTLSKDFTAPKYKYEDDPYFIPVSNITKRAFALSKESGKKAARYFLEKFPELFKCNKSEPYIKAFDPPVTFTEYDVVTETNLEELIQCSDVKNCIFVYDILEKEGIELKSETKLNLLELLCFYNCEQPPPEDFYEERFFQRTYENRVKTWQGNGLAEKLFRDMEKDGKAYSAIISGAVKFNDIQRALIVYEEMKSKDISGTISAYNSLILSALTIAQSGDSRWEFAMAILNEMTTRGVGPDLYTMNNLLEVISKDYRWFKAKSIALSTLSEMKRLNIEPSLGSYYYILRLFNGKTNILREIMAEISGKEFQIRHPSDVKFFATAMEHCWSINRDKDLAYSIHKFLEFKNNSKLLGNALQESVYFKRFFLLLCELEDIDKFMELYEKYVPNTYTPEPLVTMHVVQAIHLSGYYHHLPRICSDVILFEQSEREDILEELVEAISSIKHENQMALVDMVWKIYENIERRAETRRFVLQWTGPLLGNILKTFLIGEDMEKAWSIMQKLRTNETAILGHPEKPVLLQFCSAFHKTKEFDKVKFCIKYAENGSYPDFRKDLVSDGLVEYGDTSETKGRSEDHNQQKKSSAI